MEDTYFEWLMLYVFDDHVILCEELYNTPVEKGYGLCDGIRERFLEENPTNSVPDDYNLLEILVDLAIKIASRPTLCGDGFDITLKELGLHDFSDYDWFKNGNIRKAEKQISDVLAYLDQYIRLKLKSKPMPR